VHPQGEREVRKNHVYAFSANPWTTLYGSNDVFPHKKVPLGVKTICDVVCRKYAKISCRNVDNAVITISQAATLGEEVGAFPKRRHQLPNRELPRTQAKTSHHTGRRPRNRPQTWLFVVTLSQSRHRSRPANHRSAADAVTVAPSVLSLSLTSRVRVPLKFSIRSVNEQLKAAT